MTTHTVDAVIIGGGIAGLWTLNRLCNRGYNAILLEQKALGSDQTIASQGMIHGGIKYTLSGALTGASEAIADMPDHWRACLRGEGDVDLSGAKILSDHFYLWSTGGITGKFSGFLASKATRGRVDKVSRAELPGIFSSSQFHGTLYRLVDMVMDTGSVLAALANNYKERIYRIDWSQSRWRESDPGHWALDIQSPGGDFSLASPAFIFAAGKGNQALLDAVAADKPQMQLRPLQQVMVKHQFTEPFYGHCVAADKTPRLTISSHALADGGQVWYLGGSLAEKGVGMPPQQLIAMARKELQDLMPWLDFSAAQWATLAVERAEPRQRNLVRPDKAFAEWAHGPRNVIAAWPTKLTLSPHMAEEVENLMSGQHIQPSGAPAPALPLAHPELAVTPWQEAFGDAG